MARPTILALSAVMTLLGACSHTTFTCGCSRPRSVPDYPPSCIEVDAVQLDLIVDLVDDEVSEEILTITNPCEGMLEVTRVRLVGDDAEVFEVADLDRVLYRTDEEGSFVVRFLPQAAGTYRATVVVASTAEDEPETFIDLTGLAEDG